MDPLHCAIWLDHLEARLVTLQGDDHVLRLIHSNHAAHHAHAPHRGHRHEHVVPDLTYFAALAGAIPAGSDVLLYGPASAKVEFKSYLDAHLPQLAARVVAVEALDHLTDGQFLARARQDFRAVDRLRSNVPPHH